MSRLLMAIFSSVVFISLPLRAEEMISSRVTAKIEDETYQLDIIENRRAVTTPAQGILPSHQKRYEIDRRVRIVCTSGCKDKIRFEDEQIDAPISAFRLWDGSRDLITIWGAGSAYWVRIYRVDHGKVERVLEQASKSAPQFGMADDGSTVVILNNPDQGVLGSFQARGTVWRWNGRRFRSNL